MIWISYFLMKMLETYFSNIWKTKRAMTNNKCSIVSGELQKIKNSM